MLYWLHNEFLQLRSAKISKSAGGAPLADLTETGYHPMAFRLFLLSLGLLHLPTDIVTSQLSIDDLDAATRARIEQLTAERTTAHASKDWPRADGIRAELDTLGVCITDTPAGPAWTLK